MLDEKLELQGDEEDDVYCCGLIRTPPKPPAKVHFALPKKWHHDTGTNRSIDHSLLQGCLDESFSS